MLFQSFHFLWFLAVIFVGFVERYLIQCDFTKKIALMMVLMVLHLFGSLWQVLILENAVDLRVLRRSHVLFMIDADPALFLHCVFLGCDIAFASWPTFEVV